MLSTAGERLIKTWEGLRLRAYPDVSGYMTIGWGHRQKAPGPTSITQAFAEKLFDSDAAAAESAVDFYVKVGLSQRQRDALISLVFNWGAGNFSRSTLLKYINAKKYIDASMRLAEHPITSAGKVYRGLVRRRKAEALMFLSGTSSTPDQLKRARRHIDQFALKYGVTE